MTKRKPRMLCLLQLPPPVHGSSVMGRTMAESEVLNSSFDCQFVNIMTSRGMEEIGRNPLAKVGRYFRILWQVVIALVTWRQDLCYLAPAAKGLGFYKDFPILLLARLLSSKRVLHFHNKGVADRQHRLFDDLLYRMAFGGAHAILLSDLLRRDVKKYFLESRIHTCPNGIPDIEPAVAGNGARSNNDATRILFLSNLMVAKGVLVLLDACAILRDRGLKFECAFVGSEADLTRARFEEEVHARDLRQEVRYLGPKFATNKEGELRRSEIMAFPTLWEAFGLVLLEGMQHSLPVVASDEGGIPEIVEDGVSGFVVPKNDAVALAEKLELLISDPGLRADMGRKGRMRYERFFREVCFETRMSGILRDIVENQRCEKA